MTWTASHKFLSQSCASPSKPTQLHQARLHTLQCRTLAQRSQQRRLPHLAQQQCRNLLIRQHVWRSVRCNLRRCPPFQLDARWNITAHHLGDGSFPRYYPSTPQLGSTTWNASHRLMPQRCGNSRLIHPHHHRQHAEQDNPVLLNAQACWTLLRLGLGWRCCTKDLGCLVRSGAFPQWTQQGRTDGQCNVMKMSQDV